MSVSCCCFEHVQNPRFDPLRRVLGHTELIGDVVRCFEANAANVLRETIWVLFQHRLRLFAIGLVNAQRPRGTDAVLMKEEHDAVD